VLYKDRRFKKALNWLLSSFKVDNAFYFSNVFLNELYKINILKKGSALLYKQKYYKTLITYKLGKNYLW